MMPRGSRRHDVIEDVRERPDAAQQHLRVGQTPRARLSQPQSARWAPEAPALSGEEARASRAQSDRSVAHARSSAATRRHDHSGSRVERPPTRRIVRVEVGGSRGAGDDPPGRSPAFSGEGSVRGPSPGKLGLPGGATVFRTTSTTCRPSNSSRNCLPARDSSRSARGRAVVGRESALTNSWVKSG